VTESKLGLRDERGFTLTEVIVAAMVLVVGVLGTLTLLDAANHATAQTKQREGATNLAREVIEAARVVGYPSLVPAEIESELQAQPALADSIATEAGWNLKRREVTYTLNATVCSVDDGTLAADGFGDHMGGFFCTDSASTGSSDPNPDDYKRVSVVVTWEDGATTRSTRQEAVINNPGSAFAPAIKTLVPSTGSLTTNPPITNPATTSVTFTATTTSRPQEVKWALDNVNAGTAGGSGLVWTFTWSTPSTVADGTYLVSAEAYDQYGQAGTGRTLAMVLNRYAPAPPTGLVGGRNLLWGATFMEFEWFPNPERDILGYRVYHMLGASPAASDDLVCQTVIDDITPTSCGASGQPAGGQRYYVVATAPARSGTGEEESTRPASANTLSVGANVRPNAPTGVREDLLVDDGGTVTLAWNVPTDPDGQIRYYRIYRDDNTVYTARYGGTGSGSQSAWTDRDGVPGAHRYWVTAVDDHLAESDFAPAAGFAP
jgi:prepilin-type N-terminal cleavage/methylation domain-containing protein